MKAIRYATFFLLLLLFIVSGLRNCLAQSPSKVKTVYWNADKEKCPVICDRIMARGHSFAIFETPDFILAYSPVYDQSFRYLQVYLLNKSDKRIEFDPARSVIAVYKKRTDLKPIETRPLTLAEVEKKVKKGKTFLNLLTALAAGFAERSISSNTSGTVSDIYGNSATFNAKTTTSVPDVEAQRNAWAIIDERNRRANEKARAYSSVALLANTLFPEDELMGNIYFPYVKGEFLWAGVRVGDTVYLQGVNSIQK